MYNVLLYLLFAFNTQYFFTTKQIYTSYGIFISQILRFCKINSTSEDFVCDVNNLVGKLVNQSFLKAALRSRFYKFNES